jgi:DNA-binding transcriptional LysR family regulator
MNITLDQIECFKALAEAGSFTKAAEKLHRAKSALIYSIDNLEEQLGYRLLDRSGYRSKLTPQGKDFLSCSGKVLGSMAELKLQSSQIASRIEVRLSLSCSGIYPTPLLYPILKNAMEVFPSTQIIFEREILSGEKMLLRGMVDLAIFEMVHNRKDIDFKKIGEVELIQVIASKHDFLKLPKKEQNLQNLYRTPQIIQRSTIPDEDIRIGVHADSLSWKVTDTLSKKELILNGLGWGRLPRHEVERELKSGKLKHLAHLNDDMVVDMFICRNRDKALGVVAKLIWDSF